MQFINKALVPISTVLARVMENMAHNNQSRRTSRVTNPATLKIHLDVVETIKKSCLITAVFIPLDFPLSPEIKHSYDLREKKHSTERYVRKKRWKRSEVHDKWETDKHNHCWRFTSVSRILSDDGNDNKNNNQLPLSHAGTLAVLFSSWLNFLSSLFLYASFLFLLGSKNQNSVH